MSGSSGTDIRARVAALAMIATTVSLSLVSALGYTTTVNFTRQSQIDLLNERLDEMEARMAAGDTKVASHSQLNFGIRVIRPGDAPPETQPGTLQIVRPSRLSNGNALVGKVSTTQVDETLSAVRNGLWASVFVIGLLVGITAWVVVDRALSPVRRLTRRAKEIEANESGELLPVTESGDEIAELATTFNSMLSKLRATDSERRRFVSDASHELRTPLMVLSADAEYALDHGGDPIPLAESVLNQTGRLTTLVDDLLMLAAIDEGQATADEVRTIGDVLVGADAHSFVAELDDDVSSLHIPDVSRSIANLIANAQRHMVSNVDVTATATAETVIVTVEDDGPGVPLAERSDIFKRFYRPDDARARVDGGAGLGLAIAKAEVSQVGGTISVNDSPLGGARFTITLPIATLPFSATASPVHATPGHSTF